MTPRGTAEEGSTSVLATTPSLERVFAADPETAGLMERELVRQETTLELIPSENIASPAVLQALGSWLNNKYAEGVPGKRYYGGCEIVDQVEDLARKRACELFGADHANVQPHSGSNANMAVYQALLEPGDRVLGMALDHGGHLSHGSPVNFSGKHYDFHSYTVSERTGRIEYDEVRAVALAVRPKLIVAGYSAYPRTLDWAAFKDIAQEVGARLMVDMAHVAGLVAGGVHPSPVPHADVVTMTTHKTLRGPWGGLILCREELARRLTRPSVLEPRVVHISMRLLRRQSCSTSACSHHSVTMRLPLSQMRRHSLMRSPHVVRPSSLVVRTTISCSSISGRLASGDAVCSRCAIP